MVIIHQYTYIIPKKVEKINFIKLYSKKVLKISNKKILSERFFYKIRIILYFMNIHIMKEYKGGSIYGICKR